MKQSLKLFARAISSGQSLLSQAFSDPYEAAKHLMQSTDRGERMRGLQRLRSSKAPEAEHLALVHYRFSSDVAERRRAEDCLVALTLRSRGSAGEAALAILNTQLRFSDSFIGQRRLAHSARNLTRIMQTGRIAEEELQEIDSKLSKWNLKAPPPTSKSRRKLLDELAAPWLSARASEKLKAQFPLLFSEVNSRLQLTFALQAISTPKADLIRAEVLRTLEPGPYSQVVFKTLRPHLERAAVRDATKDLLNAWQADYGPTCLDSELIESLLHRHSGDVVGPLKLFG